MFSHYIYRHVGVALPMRIVKRSYFLSADDDEDNADLLYHGSGNGDITPNSETSHTGDTKPLTTTKYPGLQPLLRDTQHVQSGSFSLLQPSISISLKSADISAEDKLDNIVGYDALTSPSPSPTSATIPRTSFNADGATSSPVPTQADRSAPAAEQPLNTPPSTSSINISTQDNINSGATTMVDVNPTPTLMIKTIQTNTANVPRTDQGTMTIHGKTTPQSKSTTIAGQQPEMLTSEQTTQQPTITETSTLTSGEVPVSSAKKVETITDFTPTTRVAAAAEYYVEEQTTAHGQDTVTNTTTTVITTTAYPRWVSKK